MKTTYKISRITKNVTYIHEYWDDILIYKYKVYAVYHGGDIEEFVHKNRCFRNPDFDGIDEYHRRIFILDF